MRAAFLPYPGDPFLFHYWLHFFDTVWSDEIDRLYVYLNSPIEQPVVDYIRELCATRPKINFQYNNVQIEHGNALNRMLEICTEEYVMFVEDDGFIFKKGQVDAAFKALESGQFEVVGSKRGSCSQEILSRAQQLWGLDYTGEGDQGCNFWPNFFFTTRSKLLQTNREFGARAWKRGEHIEPLDRGSDKYLAQDEIVTSDTFVYASLQIQSITPQSKILYLPQYHGSPDDLDHFQRNYNLFNGAAGWCHVGSLSSGVGGILQDSNGRSLARRLIDPSKGEKVLLPNYCHTEQEKYEWERRIQWWLTFFEKREPGKIDEFAHLYWTAIQAVIAQYELNTRRIERRQRAYQTIGL